MKTLTVYLTNIASSAGDTMTGYLFTNAITNVPTSYSLTADGGIGTNDFAYTYSYAQTASDGAFFPYGFGIQDRVFNLSIPTLKGDYTIIFCLTGLTTNPVKVVYNFGDNTPLLTVLQPLINSLNFTSLNPYLFGDSFQSPKYQVISHNYYAPNSCNISITAVNSDLTINTFNIPLTQTSNSIYDFNAIRILDVAQQSTGDSNSMNFIEINDNKMVTSLALSPNTNSKYPVPYQVSSLSGTQNNTLSTPHLVFVVT